MNDKEITNKWNKTGLLDNMKEKDVNKMAVILDTIAKELVKTCPPPNTPEKVKYEEFCGTILPIARRLYDRLKGKNFPDTKWLIEDYKDYHKKNGDMIKELNSYISLNGEAEFCSLYCESLVKKIKEGKCLEKPKREHSQKH